MMVQSQTQPMANRIDTLPHINAQYNSNPRESCLNGTRTALLRRIYDWVENGLEGPLLFCLTGRAGSGKSTIAQTVAEYYDQQRCLGASLFISPGTSDIDPRLIVNTIAYQLSMFDPTLKLLIAETLDAYPDADEPDQSTQFQRLIVTPLRRVESTQSQTPPVLVIIDAFDGYTDIQSASAILTLLATHIHSLPHLRLLITTRPESHIRDILNSELMSPLSYTLNLDEADVATVRGDIEFFFRQRFLDSAAAFTGDQPISWPTENELVGLADRASGSFLFAALAVRYIEDQSNSEKHNDMLHIMANAPTRLSPPLEDSFDALYNMCLRRLLPESVLDPHQDHYLIVISTIVMLCNPLPLPALAKFLDIESTFIRTILDGLQPITRCPTTEDTLISPIHHSFTSFLADKRRCSHQRVIIDIPSHHIRLAFLCLQHMVSLLKHDICAIGDPSKLNFAIDDLEPRLELAAPLELRYACFHWASHLSWGSRELNLSLLEQLDLFFCTHLLHWLELLSLLGSLDIAISCLHDARNWLLLSSDGHKHDLLKLLDAAEQFILENFEVISNSALLIYSSVQRSTKQDGLLFKTFEHESVIKEQEAAHDLCIRVIPYLKTVRVITFSPDGTRIAIGGSQDSLIILDTSSTNVISAHLEDLSHEVLSISFSPNADRFISGDDHGIMHLWDASTLEVLHTVQGHVGWAHAVSFLPDGTRILSGGQDNWARIWDSSMQSTLVTIDCRNAILTVACLDNTRVICGCIDGTMFIWDPQDGRILHTVKSHTEMVRSLSVSPDGTHFVSGAQDGTVQLWDSLTITVLDTLHLQAQILSVAFSHDGTYIVCGSRDCNTILWSLLTQEVLALGGHTMPIWAVSTSPHSNLISTGDGSGYVSGSVDPEAGDIRVWDPCLGMVPILEVHPTLTMFDNIRNAYRVTVIQNLVATHVKSDIMASQCSTLSCDQPVRHPNHDFITKCMDLVQGAKMYQRVSTFIFRVLQLSGTVLSDGDLQILCKALETWSTWDDLTQIIEYRSIEWVLGKCLRGWHEVLYDEVPNWNEQLQDKLACDRLDIADRLSAILADKGTKRTFLALKGRQAQSALNLLQQLIETPNLPPEFKPVALNAVNVLSKKSGCYPECFSVPQLEIAERPVAYGGFADVSEGVLLGRKVAVKALRLYKDNDLKDILKIFSHEAVLWRQLSHPNLLPFYGVYRARGNSPMLCLLSPWMEKGNMVDYLKDNPSAERNTLLLDVARGLNYLHNFKPTVVHGDLKCVNILITPSDTACLTDFGIAAIRDTQTTYFQSTTAAVQGTLRWLAPELLRHEGKTSPESDIYAFGCVCYEAFTGKTPFYESPDYRVLVLVLGGHRPPFPPSDICIAGNPDRDIWNLIEKCWQDESSKRPTACDIIEELELNQCIQSKHFDGWDVSFLSEYRTSLMDSQFFGSPK